MACSSACVCDCDIPKIRDVFHLEQKDAASGRPQVRMSVNGRDRGRFLEKSLICQVQDASVF
jgi:hypothetical protein